MRFSKTIPLYFLCWALACKQPVTDNKETSAEAALAETGTTPVTLTSPIMGDLTETIELNAVSTFQLKTFVKSSATGYLQQVNAAIGKQVYKGQVLFVLKTKESQSLGNTITSLDSSMHFSGAIQIKSPGTGFISLLNYQPGDYVQDGEQMAVITDSKSFVFMLALPYELKPYLDANRQLTLKLPDGTMLNGYVAMSMPTVDAGSQTQNQVIRVATDKPIPENLVAKVSLVKQSRPHTISLPKAAVLSDEIQSRFWIMKMTDSVTAIKIPVTKGLETADRVEILSPKLLANDKIIVSGNYGLPDTARVTIIK